MERSERFAAQSLLDRLIDVRNPTIHFFVPSFVVGSLLNDLSISFAPLSLRLRASAPSHSPASFARLRRADCVVTLRNRMIPWPGRDREGRNSRISVSTMSKSPGRTALGQRNSSTPSPIAPFGEVQRLHEQPHAHRRSVPATGNQPFENASLRTSSAKMKHLRIELMGKLDKLFFRHPQRLGFEPVTRFQIIEIALLHDENDNTLMRHRVY